MKSVKKIIFAIIIHCYFVATALAQVSISVDPDNFFSQLMQAPIVLKAKWLEAKTHTQDPRFLLHHFHLQEKLKGELPQDFWVAYERLSVNAPTKNLTPGQDYWLVVTPLAELTYYQSLQGVGIKYRLINIKRSDCCQVQDLQPWAFANMSPATYDFNGLAVDLLLKIKDELLAAELLGDVARFLRSHESNVANLNATQLATLQQWLLNADAKPIYAERDLQVLLEYLSKAPHAELTLTHLAKLAHGLVQRKAIILLQQQNVSISQAQYLTWYQGAADKPAMLAAITTELKPWTYDFLQKIILNSSQNRPVQQAAINRLEQLNTPEAKHLLMRSLKSPDDALIVMLLNALVAYDPPELVPLLEAWLVGKNDLRRTAAGLTIKRLKNPAARRADEKWFVEGHHHTLFGPDLLGRFKHFGM